MAEEYILVEKQEGIATITLNRPDRLNALTPEMRVQMRKALEDAEEDVNVRVIIITGAGRGFCSGADVATVTTQTERAEDEPHREHLLQPVATYRLVTLIHSLNKPTICALNGVAVGAGTGLSLACDIIIASDQARFRVGFTRMGLPPGDGISYLLPRRVGTHRALELAYTNDIIDAKEMERIGLVNKVVPAEELMKAAKELAKKMFQIPPITLALAKKTIYRGLTAADLEGQMAFDHLIGKTLSETEDRKEAQKSFMEKRDPIYKGK